MCLRIISRRFDVLVIFSNEGIEWRWVIAGVIPTETEVLLSILILFLTESLTEPRPLNPKGSITIDQEHVERPIIFDSTTLSFLGLRRPFNQAFSTYQTSQTPHGMDGIW